jgi:hypothetical protein
VDIDDVVAKLDELYYEKSIYDEVADACFAVTQRPEYRWEHVAAGFSKAIEDLLV